MPPFGNFGHQISDFSGEEKIWRYLDLAKFIDLFAKRRVYFRRVDLLDDKYEGMPTEPLLRYLRTQYVEFDREISGIFQRDPVEAAEQSLIELRECNFVNCWYLSNHESNAMWSLYSSIDGGIAIQSTIKRLHAAIPEKNVYIGKVAYVNYDTAEIAPDDDLRSILFLKRNHFDSEREVRILYSIEDAKRDPAKTGYYVDDVVLEQMIQSIVLAPGTPAWLDESMRALMRQACPGIEILPSAMGKDPPIKRLKMM